MRKLKGIFTLVIAFAMALMLNTNVALAAPAAENADAKTVQRDAAYYKDLLSQMFNAKEYKELNHEIAKKVGNNEKALFNHYLKTGVYSCLRSEELVPDWSAKWFTRLMYYLVGECPGQDVSVLLAKYAANPDNYGKVQALDIIFDSMILTGMPPYEMLIASATQAVEVAPGITMLVINPPGGGPSLTIWLTSSAADMSAFAAAGYRIDSNTELKVDTIHDFVYDVTVDAGGKLTVMSGGKLRVGLSTPTVSLTNNGTIETESGGAIFVWDTSILDNEANIINNGDIYGNDSCQLINNGTIENEGMIADMAGMGGFTGTGTITGSGSIY